MAAKLGRKCCSVVVTLSYGMCNYKNIKIGNGRRKYQIARSFLR